MILMGFILKSIDFRMKPIRITRTVLHRLVWEAKLIEKEEIEQEGVLMNSRGEFGKNKMVRFAPQVTKI